jgi:hypothetical protein
MLNRGFPLLNQAQLFGQPGTTTSAIKHEASTEGATSRGYTRNKGVVVGQTIKLSHGDDTAAELRNARLQDFSKLRPIHLESKPGPVLVTAVCLKSPLAVHFFSPDPPVTMKSVRQNRLGDTQSFENGFQSGMKCLAGRWPRGGPRLKDDDAQPGL